MTDYFHLDMPREQLLGLSSLGLAHLGDAVYELMVRSWLCLHGKATNKGLHKAAVTYVSAPAQARRAEKILPMLREEEADVFRRGRNSHTAAIPKGAYTVALCIEGKQLSSEELAQKLGELGTGGTSSVAFIIGSSHGISPTLKAACNLRISMSKMTFPHMLARVMLTEQIYRAYTIIADKKYHK